MFYAETTVFSKKILFCFFKTDKNLNSHDILKLIVPFNGIEKKAHRHRIARLSRFNNKKIHLFFVDIVMHAARIVCVTDLALSAFYSTQL